jgi:F-type H+-transporting ATPase subunit b
LDAKTGNTGFALLSGGVAAYLLSKEILIFHAETVVVFSIGAVTAALIKNFGKDIAASLDERSKVQTGRPWQ